MLVGRIDYIFGGELDGRNQPAAVGGEEVTTVGYGDVTPHRIVGRLVAAVVMVTGIGFLTIVTAAVTSVFVEASRRRATELPETPGEIGDPPARDIATVNRRLDQIERTLALLVEQTRPR